MATRWLHVMDESGQTPLDRAFRSGHMTLAETILRQEKEELTGNPTGAPLHRAAQLGLHRAVASLLQCGADPRALNQYGETPLHAAVRGGDLQTVRALAPHSDVNALCIRGLSPLHWASIAGRADICEVLCAYSADPWLQGKYIDGLSPVAIAQSMEYAHVAELLSADGCYACAG